MQFIKLNKHLSKQLIYKSISIIILCTILFVNIIIFNTEIPVKASNIKINYMEEAIVKEYEPVVEISLMNSKEKIVEKETNSKEKIVEKETNSKEKIVEKETNTKTNPNTDDKKYIGKFKITGYCGESADCHSLGGRTSTGIKATANHTIAVDPKVIPYGTKVYIEGYGCYVAEDCGVKGNIIDIYMGESKGSHNKEYNVTAKNINVYIINN